MSAAPQDQQHPSATASESNDSRYLLYGRIAEQIEAARRSGRQLDVTALVAAHPDMGDEIREFVTAMSLLEEIKPEAEGDVLIREAGATTELRGVLGDFRILREIGRGGMGVVYEAEQVSLGRRLALKVLPFAATLDPRQLQRFRNEAQAAAALKHPNIVGIHSVGCERGVHYYAMELVEGRTLDQLIEELRHLSSRPASADELPPVSHVTRDLVAGQLGQTNRKKSGSDDPTQELAPSATSQPPASGTQSLASDTQPEAQAAVSTQGLHRTAEFFRSAAQLGIQAAEALEHAHQMGVVHRDIKPSNLMVDDAGHLWITDFGLAMTQKDPALTMTGDIVGTLRYMSPEQALGRRREMDHRTDIYSLGITLYELLTLRPAFVGESRATLVRSLLEQDPPPPRRVDPAIPRDLETIVLKATAKESSQRYPTVQEMADDLKRFLTDEPIHARRASLANRTAKWARRHRPAVWSAVILLVTATVAIAGLAWNRYQQSVQLASDVGAHVAAADAFLKSADYAAGDRELADARGHLETADYGAGPLAEEVDRLTAEFAAKQRAIEQFDQFQQLRHRIHSEMYAVDQTILGQAQEHSRAALNLFGVFEDEPWKLQTDFENLDTERQAMLDEGAVELLFISARLELRISDTQPAAERTAGYRRAIEALEKIETSHPNIPAVALWLADCWAAIGDTPASAEARARAESLQPTSATDYYLLGEYRAQHGQQDEAMASYWQALARQPDHYLSLLAAGVALGELKEYQTAEAMLTGAIAMNPQTVLAYAKRGLSRLEQRKILLAQADFRQAAELDPELARALTRRAITYRENLEFDKAIADCSEAIRLDPNSSLAYAERGASHLLMGNLDAALADCTEAIRLEPSSAVPYVARAAVHNARVDCDKAIADCNEAIRLDPKVAWAYLERGNAHLFKSDPEKALADFEEAIRLAPSAAFPYVGRAAILNNKGDRDKAIADCNEAIRLDPKLQWAYIQRGMAYAAKGDTDKALADYTEAIRLKPIDANGYAERGCLYLDMHEFEKAAADLDRAAELAGISYHYYKRRAAAHFQLQHYDKALESIAKAVDLTPGDFSNLTWLDPAAMATCPDERLRSGLLELADKTIQWAEDTTDGSRAKSFHGFQTAAGAYRARAILYAAFGQPEMALADFAKAIELEPQHPAVWTQRAGFYIEQGKWEQALADFEQALEVQPANAGDCNNLAWYLATCPEPRARKPERAVELATKATELAPSEGMHWNTLGVAQYGAGQFNESITTLTKSMELRSGGDAFDWFFLAMAQWQLNNKDEARTWYDKAVEWTDKNKPGDEELLRFRAAAAELLGIAENAPGIEEQIKKAK